MFQVPGGTASTDATLRGLTLEDGGGTEVELNETFASTTTDYTADVGDAVDEITVTPELNDDNATFEILDASDMVLTDADTSTDGHQVDLAVGETFIAVRVTASDGSITQTYTVTVTRAQYVCEAPDFTGRRAVWTADMTVGAFDLDNERQRLRVRQHVDSTTGTLSDRFLQHRRGDEHGSA